MQTLHLLVFITALGYVTVRPPHFFERMRTYTRELVGQRMDSLYEELRSRHERRQPIQQSKHDPVAEKMAGEILALQTEVTSLKRNLAKLLAHMKTLQSAVMSSSGSMKPAPKDITSPEEITERVEAMQNVVADNFGVETTMTEEDETIILGEPIESDPPPARHFEHTLGEVLAVNVPRKVSPSEKSQPPDEIEHPITAKLHVIR